MNLFPDYYEKPVLLDICDAASMGWGAVCSDGSSAGPAGSTCANGSGAGYSGCAFPGKGLFDNSGEGSQSRLINPGDVSQGL